MRSPFPGMDPYLEEHWRDIHARLIVFSSGELQRQLPPDLRARVEERVFVESDEPSQRAIYPDVRVIERPAAPRPTPGVAQQNSGNIALAESIKVKLEAEPSTETFIEIVEVGSAHKVVTVIEFLSYSNKVQGQGQEQFIKKQRELKQGGVSIVEIDLLRAGKRALIVPQNVIPRSYRTTYQVAIWRPWKPDEGEIVRAPLERRLPTIRIPLREKDAEVPLDLQALIERCYVEGGYDDIDYSRPPDPPLTGTDAEYAATVLK